MKLISTLFLLFILTLIKAQHNVILIIADDLGTDYCGFYENHLDTAPMPNIRKLIPHGIRFVNAWSNPVCSPTRAGILTGRYSFRTGVGNAIGGSSSGQLDTNEITIAKLLRDNAPTKYSTANIGKWHLNIQTPQTQLYPNKMGYNYYAGNFLGALPSYTNWNKITNGVLSTSTNYATSETVNDAIAWLDTQNTKPFFLWLAFNAPHSPFHLPPDSLHSYHSLSGTAQDINQNPKLYFKAMVESMDHEIGRLFNFLKSNNKWDSTDIIFIGDNGDAQRVAQNADTSRSKGTIYQNGINVPFIISGPSVKNPNRVSDALINTQDLFATILELASYKNWQLPIPITKPIDSKSLLPIIRNDSTAIRDWAFTEVFTPIPADGDGKTMRNKFFKLIIFDNGEQEFYNLKNDSDELTDILKLKRLLTPEETSNYYYLCGEMGKLLGKTVCASSIGIKKECESSKIILLPNPAKNEITIQFEHDKNFNFSIFSAEGKLILEGRSSGKIDISKLAEGIYFARIIIDEKYYNQKICIER
jgi:arylsulfatase A-like enzyme